MDLSLLDKILAKSDQLRDKVEKKCEDYMRIITHYDPKSNQNNNQQLIAKIALEFLILFREFMDSLFRLTEKIKELENQDDEIIAENDKIKWLKSLEEFSQKAKIVEEELKLLMKALSETFLKLIEYIHTLKNHIAEMEQQLVDIQNHDGKLCKQLGEGISKIKEKIKSDKMDDILNNYPVDKNKLAERFDNLSEKLQKESMSSAEFKEEVRSAVANSALEGTSEEKINKLTKEILALEEIFSPYNGLIVSDLKKENLRAALNEEKALLKVAETNNAAVNNITNQLNTPNLSEANLSALSDSIREIEQCLKSSANDLHSKNPFHHDDKIKAAAEIRGRSNGLFVKDNVPNLQEKNTQKHSGQADNIGNNSTSSSPKR